MAQLSTPILHPPGVEPYTIRDAKLDEDAVEIVRLCKAGGLHSSMEKHHWKYETCIGYPPWCKLAIDTESGWPIGTTALFPRRLLVDGTVLSAAVAGDFAVETRHRTLYSALSLQKSALQACREGRFDVIYGFPNDAARLVQLRAGYVPIGAVRVGVRLLRTRRFFESRGESRWWLSFADLFDSIVRFFASGSRRQAPSDYNYSELSSPDERFDRFWTVALREYHIVVERSSSYVDWRFMKCPYKQYHLFVASHRQTNEIGGYILWSVSPDGKVRIADLMAFDHVLDGLLTAFSRLQQEREASCIIVVYFGGDRLVRRLRGFGFFFRKTRSQVLVSVSPQVPDAARLFDPNNWYLLEGDSDS